MENEEPLSPSLRALLESAWQADTAFVFVGSAGGDGEMRLVRLPSMRRDVPGRPHRPGRLRPVVVDGVTFPSIASAEKAAGLSTKTLRYRLVNGGGRCEFGGHEIEWGEEPAEGGTDGSEGSAR